MMSKMAIAGCSRFYYIGIILTFSIFVSFTQAKTPKRCRNLKPNYRFFPGCYDEAYLKEEGEKLANIFVQDKTKLDVTGYVTTDGSFENSGVHIGYGFDLGSFNKSDFDAKKVPSSLVNMLEPYLGKTGSDAKTVLTSIPLVLSKEEVKILNDFLIARLRKERSQQYGYTTRFLKDKKKEKRLIRDFDSLTKVQTTVILSVFMEPDGNSKKDEFWDAMTVQPPNTNKAIQLLQQFDYDNQYYRRLATYLENDDGTRCCSGELYGGQCYFEVTEKKTFIDARDHCRNNNGDLAVLASEKVIDALRMSDRIIKSGTDYWIGATDCTNINSRSFTWVDGYDVSNITYKNHWTNQKPNKDKGDCVAYKPKNENMRERFCDEILPFICEVSMQDKPIGTNSKPENDEEIEGPMEIINKNCGDGNDKSIKSCDMKISNLGLSKLEVGTNLDEAIGGDELPDSQLSSIPARRKKRNALSPIYRYWMWTHLQTGPTYKVPYVINVNQFSTAEVSNITQALQGITDKTCIKYERYNDGPSAQQILPYYLLITRNGGSYGCWSYVGRAADSGPSTLNLGQNHGDCSTVGVIQHECMHSLGFWHEQSRPDRDDYISVDLGNIDPNKAHNFDKYNSYTIDTQSVSYDYDSVLHYGPYAFALAPNKPTIRTIRPPGATVGQRHFMTENDIAEINLLYNCPNVIHGGWGLWTMWSKCSQTCGSGTMTRSRKCDLPFPKNGGKACSGSTIETNSCSDMDCPNEEINFRWYGCWDDPRLPSLMLSIEGQGSLLDDYKTRGTKTVEKCAREAKNQGYKIFGLKDGQCQVLEKNQEADPKKYVFIDASDKCVGTKHGAIDALDVYIIGNISIQGYYGVWGEYSICTKTCKPSNGTGGTRMRTRECVNPPPNQPGDLGCEGSPTEVQDCNTQDCPVDGQWGEWSSWSICTTSCEPGVRMRTRKCDNPPPKGGKICEGFITTVDVQNQTCNQNEPCPLRTDCPVVKVPVTPAFANVKAYYSFEESCTKNATIPGAYNMLVSYNDPNNKVVLGPGRKGNALLLDDTHKYKGVFNAPQVCLHQPETCTSGFTVAFWIKPQDHDTTQITSPQMIFTTGVEAHEGVTSHSGQGVAIYLTADNKLKVIVRTSMKIYNADLPAFYITTSKFHFISITFTTEHGLKLFYGGIAKSWDNKGSVLDGLRLPIYNFYSLGRICNCNKQTYTGYIDELTIFANSMSEAKVDALYMSVPVSCADCDGKAECINNKCVCKTLYAGNGWHCERDMIYAGTLVDLGVPLFYWPMDKIQGTIISPSENVPGLLGRSITANKEMLSAVGIRNNALVFDGRSNWVDAGSYKKHCLAVPDLCENGITFAFYLKYGGRGLKKNFVFSTGASPWNKVHTTGFSMWVESGMINVYVQTKTQLYSDKFPVYPGVWEHYTITWNLKDGILVYDNAEPILNSYKTGSNQVAKESPDGKFVLGTFIQSSGFNGRFDMDELVVYGKALNKAQVEALYSFGVEHVTHS